jgi:hypothetical protein
MVFAATVWIALAGCYLLLTGSVGATELLAGAGATLPVAAFAVLAHRRAERRLSLRAPWPRIVRTALAALVRDTAPVAWALLTGRKGSVAPQPFDAAGDAAEGRRAIVILAASLAPNGFVVATDRHCLRLHRLMPRAPLADTGWPL